MRVSTKQLQQFGINTILRQQAKVAQLQEQIASGKRITTPSEDPSGAVRILDLRKAIDTTQQYQDNITLVEQRLELEDTTLASAVNNLQRVRELAIQGNSDFQNTNTRRMIAVEVRQRLDDLLALSNTRDANGEYIFAGFQSGTKPFVAETDGTFTYNGDQGQRFLQISETRQVADSDTGTVVFRDIPTGNGTFQITDNLANTGSGIIDPGSVVDPTAIDGDTYRIQFADQTTVTGGAIGIFDDNANDVLNYELRINGTLVDTVPEGASRTQAQLAASIQAASGATGVTAFLDAGVLYLANTGPTGNAITVSETLTGATEDTDTVTGYFGSQLTGLTTPSTSITFDAPADSYVVLDSANNIEASGSYQDGAGITFNGIETNVIGAPNNGDEFTVSPSVAQDIFTTVQNLVLALEAGAGDPTTLGEFHNAMNRALIDMDRALDNFSEVRAAVGARLNAVDGQTNVNEDLQLSFQKTLASVEDLDLAAAASLLQQELSGLEAAQAAFVRVQGLSLFDFL